MQQWIDLNTKVANDGLAALKQLGEINLKAAESVYGQQQELAQDFGVTAKSNVEKLSAVKDQQGLLDVQNEIFQSSVTSALGNWKQAIEVVTTSQKAYRELAEEVMQTAKGNMEQTAASVKETTEAVKKAVKPKKKAAAKKAA